MAGRLRRVQQRDAKSYIGARARVGHAHARICESYFSVMNKNDR